MPNITVEPATLTVKNDENQDCEVCPIPQPMRRSNAFRVLPLGLRPQNSSVPYLPVVNELSLYNLPSGPNIRNRLVGVPAIAASFPIYNGIHRCGSNDRPQTSDSQLLRRSVPLRFCKSEDFPSVITRALGPEFTDTIPPTPLSSPETSHAIPAATSLIFSSQAWVRQRPLSGVRLAPLAKPASADLKLTDVTTDDDCCPAAASPRIKKHKLTRSI